MLLLRRTESTYTHKGCTNSLQHAHCWRSTKRFPCGYELLPVPVAGHDQRCCTHRHTATAHLAPVHRSRGGGRSPCRVRRENVVTVRVVWPVVWPVVQSQSLAVVGKLGSVGRVTGGTPRNDRLVTSTVPPLSTLKWYCREREEQRVGALCRPAESRCVVPAR